MKQTYELSKKVMFERMPMALLCFLGNLLVVTYSDRAYELDDGPLQNGVGHLGPLACGGFYNSYIYWRLIDG